MTTKAKGAICAESKPQAKPMKNIPASNYFIKRYREWAEAGRPQLR